MIVLLLVAVYYALGVLFAIAFITMGITKVDEGAKETGLGFKLILIPGIALFWPVLLNKWRKAK
jgi:ABC-type Na+ efflux pump permease subunit